MPRASQRGHQPDKCITEPRYNLQGREPFRYQPPSDIPKTFIAAKLPHLKFSLQLTSQLFLFNERSCDEIHRSQQVDNRTAIGEHKGAVAD